jgi:O-antigen/teichoic acid export membrane protein
VRNKPGSGLREIVGGAGVTLLGAAAGGAVMYLNEILAARFLGLRTYGLFALALTLAKICEILSFCGLTGGSIRFVSIHIVAQRPERVVGTVLASLALPVLLGSTLAALVWALAPWLSQQVFHDPGVQIYIQRVSLAVPLMAFSGMAAVVTRGFGFSKYYVLVKNLIPPLVFCGLMVFLVRIGADLLRITDAFILSYAVAALAGLVSLLRLLGPSLWKVRPAFDLRSLYGYSLPLLVNSILYVVLAWTDIVVLGMFWTTDVVGIYRACTQTALAMTLIGASFNAATSHIFPVLSEAGRLAELRQAYERSTRWVTAVSVPVFLVVVLNARTLLGLLGPEFTAGAGALAILCFGNLLNNSMSPAAWVLIMGGRQTVETANCVATAALNLLLNLWGSPRYGLWGAAIATTVSLSAINLVRGVEIRRLIGIPAIAPPVLKIYLAGCLAGAAILAAASWLGMGAAAGLGWLGVRAAAILVLFGGALWAAGLEPEDRELVVRLTRRRNRLGAPVAGAIDGQAL